MKPLKTESDVRDLLHAAAESAALGTAIETGLLWRLAETPMDEEGVAVTMNIPFKRCSYWLQFLHALGILEKSVQGYSPSALTRSAILESWSRESWMHLVLDERERSAGVHNLALHISHPGSVWAAQGLVEPRDYVEKMKRDPVRAREFTYTLYEVHQHLAKELAAILDLANVHRLLDVGGGSGVISMALLRKYPDLTAMVIDLENVCTVGREIAEENLLSDRITYRPLDLEEDDLPGGFDLVMHCDFGMFGEEFLRKLWNSLNPGGRIVIVDYFSQSENVIPPSRLEWTFLDSLEDPDYSYQTLAQTQSELVRAGFHLLDGEHTLSDNRVLIQAQK